MKKNKIQKQIVHLVEEIKRLNDMVKTSTTKKEHGRSEINIPKILNEIFEKNKKLNELYDLMK